MRRILGVWAALAAISTAASGAGELAPLGSGVGKVVETVEAYLSRLGAKAGVPDMDDTRGRIVTYYPNISDITVRHEGTSTVAEADFIDDEGRPSKGLFLILGAPLNPRVADLSFHPVQLPAYAIIRRQVSATLGCGDKPCE